jgi:hypothetical protein
MNKKKFTRVSKKCKVRINLKRFENIRLHIKEWGFDDFSHCLN